MRLVRALERQRFRALVDVDETSLARVEVRGTQLWRHDTRLLSQLRATHAHLRDSHVDVRSVRVLSVHSGLVVLRVVDAFSSYHVVDMRLQRVRGTWLIADVSRRSP
jgi:hypothetical protein